MRGWQDFLGTKKLIIRNKIKGLGQGFRNNNVYILFKWDGLLGVVKQGRGPMGILLLCSNVYILFKWDGLLGVVKQGRGPRGI